MAGPYDFSGAFANLNNSISNLGKQFQVNREREAFGTIGQGLADGSLDYKKAAGSLAQLGRLDAAIDLMKLGETQRQRLAGEEATRSLGTAIGGLNVGGLGSGGLPPLGAAAPTSTGSALPVALNSSESGGNWQAQNNEVGAGGAVGHFGRAQFGQARLQEAANAGAIPPGTTPEQFMQSPQLQRAAENWHFADIDKFIAGNGYGQLIGQSINGIPITADGMRAVAHLGGKQGLQRFIETRGQYNPSDANGTSLMDYLRLGAGSSGVRTAAADAPAPGAVNASLDTGTQGFAIPGQPSMTGRTFDAITSGNRPLDPAFVSEGVSQPWMGTALANIGRSGMPRQGQVLPPVRPSDLRADQPAPGAVPAIGQMPPIDRAGAVDIDPNSNDAGSRTFALWQAQQAERPTLPAPVIPAQSSSDRAADLPAPGAVPTQGSMPMPISPQAQAAAPVPSSALPRPTNAQEATNYRETRAMENRQGKVGQLATALANPNLPANARAIGEIFLKDALEQSKAPDSVKEFMYARGMGWTQAKTLSEYNAEKEKAKDKGPISVQEYEYAQRGGYKGSYLEFQRDKAEATKAKDTMSDKVDENTTAADKLRLQGDERKFFIANGRLPTAGEKTTEGQANAALYADRMKAADTILNDQGSVDAMTSRYQRGAAINGTASGFLNSEAFKKAQQAKMDFITAKLRRESGAAISVSEFETDDKTFFPQPGDPPSVIAQKAQARKRVIEGISNAAGPSYAKRQAQAGPQDGGQPSQRSQSASAPPAAVDFLRANPGARDQFDAKYGAGAAAQVLGR